MRGSTPHDTATDVRDADWGSAPVPKVAKFIGVSESTAWRLIKAGELSSFSIGRCRLVSRTEALAFIERKQAESVGVAA